MHHKEYEAIILGGGLSGLSAAYHSGFPVFEARPQPGGAADSVSRDGFVFDLGIHVLQSQDPYFLDLMQRLGVTMATHERSAWIYCYGNYFPYPFQVNTSHLPWPVRVRCVLGFLTRRRRAASANYEEWMVHNFGRGFADTFLIPYAEKFWRHPPADMTFEWTGQRVPVPRLWDVVRGAFQDLDTKMGTNAVFDYPNARGYGFSAIARALADQVPHLYIDRRVTAIDPGGKRVVFNHGSEVVTYRRLITSIPLPDFIQLLPEPPVEVQEAAAQLAYNSIAIVNLGINRPDLSPKHWVHFPEHEISFFRISIPSNFCPGLSPPGTSSIQAEVAYDAPNPPNRQELRGQVVADLRRVGVLGGADQVVFEDVIYQRYGYVVYTQARQEAVAVIHRYLRELDIFPCGRYGDWEYLWADQAILSGKRVAEKVLAQIDANGLPEVCLEAMCQAGKG
jgi:UDP-galactopyranose mutase